MSDFEELWKGLSDLPITLLAIVFGCLLLRRQARAWSGMFFLTAVSALFGATVHGIAIPQFCLSVLWCGLYMLLFELIRRFALLITDCITGKREREQRPVLVLEAGLYLAAVLCLFLWKSADIYMLVLFAALLVVRIAFCLIRHPGAPRRVKILMLTLLAALLFQGLKTVIPYGVVLGHVTIAAAECVAYRIGCGEA